jgi:PBSX family phage terminase large subunit
METKVLTPKGFRLIGDIKVGSQVCNPDGTIARVIGVFDNGPKQFYRVTLADGSSVEADEDHLWAVSFSSTRKRRKVGPPIIPPGLRPEDEWNLRVQSRCTIINTKELRRFVLRAEEHKAAGWHAHGSVLIPLTNPVSMNGGASRWPTFSPYTLGVLLGDGHLAEVSVSFTSADPEVAERVAAELPENLHIGRTDQSNTGKATNHHITRKRYNKPLTEGGFVDALIAARKRAGLTQKALGAKADLLQSHVSQIERRQTPASVAAAGRLDAALGEDGGLVELHSGECMGDSAPTLLKREGLHFLRSWEKFVPARVKIMPVADRFAFVQGLMDTDGTIDKLGHASFTSVSERLALDLRDVLHSLGYRATVSTRTSTYTHNGEKRTGRLAYTLYIQGRHMDKLFHVQRKRDRVRSYLGAKHNVEPWHRIVSVEPTQVDNSRCIQVDNLNHLYVTDDYIVTHNTVASLVSFLIGIAQAPDQGLILACGRTLPTIERNLILPLQDPELFGPIARQVHHVRGSSVATILGRTVHLIGAPNALAEGKLRGLTAYLIAIDEATLIPQDFVVQAMARLSVPGSRMVLTTNPSGPRHWLRQKYLLRENDSKLGLRQWHFLLDDNTKLDPTIVDNIKSAMSGVFYQRNVLGRWVQAEGAIYQAFDEDRHIVRGVLPPMAGIPAVGVDVGTTNPFHAVMLGVTHDRRLIITREWRHDSRVSQRTMTNAEYSQALRKWVPPDNPTWIVVDPAAADFRATLQRDGEMRVIAGDNSVLSGIQLVSSLFATDRLVIHESCKDLLDEVPSYVWSEKASERGVDEPVKEDDHGLDAMRYAIKSSRTIWQSHVPVTTLPQAA